MATYFRSLIEEYGGLVSLNLLGMRVILIGDIEVAKDLLEKHAAKHSSRPVMPYVHYHIDPLGAYWASCEEGETHTTGRKLTAGVMSTVRAGKTERLQEFEAILNIQKLLDDGGKDWFHHIERVIASTALTAGFGMHCPTGHEQDLQEVLKAIDEAVGLFSPAASIINVFPFLDLIPGPMPWRTRALSFRKREDAIYKKITDKALVGNVSTMNTWASAFASKAKPEGDQRRMLRQFTGTTSSLQTFVLACIRYPAWVVAAQMELDTVLGPDRLPSFEDRPYLPYIEAVVRETLRWRPTGALGQPHTENILTSVYYIAARSGLPHQSTEDDVIEYRGQEYYIPKGSTIFAVAWAMEHDQSRYEDHDRFMPERFLDAEGKLKLDYNTSAFGFGRRMVDSKTTVCPGIPFAERSLWIDIATMLWTFDIRASLELDPTTGLQFHYNDDDTAYNGDPRSSERADVARREWAECEKDLNVLLPTPKDK
ncbi:hypothetical protein DXG01_008943 [Tephrocybe rancida]|nr:hypothetical protein DXG01_008943 [Tephrocybe rancida]